MLAIANNLPLNLKNVLSFYHANKGFGRRWFTGDAPLIQELRKISNSTASGQTELAYGFYHKLVWLMVDFMATLVDQARSLDAPAPFTLHEMIGIDHSHLPLSQQCIINLLDQAPQNFFDTVRAFLRIKEITKERPAIIDTLKSLSADESITQNSEACLTTLARNINDSLPIDDALEYDIPYTKVLKFLYQHGVLNAENYAAIPWGDIDRCKLLADALGKLYGFSGLLRYPDDRVIAAVSQVMFAADSEKVSIAKRISALIDAAAKEGAGSLAFAFGPEGGAGTSSHSQALRI
jgi:hypothetical protein